MTAAGTTCIGVARKLTAAELETGLTGSSNPQGGGVRRAWCVEQHFAVGDVVGIAFGQTDLPNLSFTKNGRPLSSFDVKKVCICSCNCGPD